MATENTEIDDRLFELETRLRGLREEIAELRRQRSSREVVEDYLLADSTGEVRLSDLFGAGQDLLVIHNMGKGCPYCTHWADGFVGHAKAIEARSALVVISDDPPSEQAAFARSRGWPFRMVSSGGTSFKKDLDFLADDGTRVPGVSAFRKDADGTIRHVGKAFFGPGDEFCPTWHFFDLLEGGVGDWRPRFEY